MRGRLLILSIVLAGMSVASCGDDDSTTSPPPVTVSKILNFRAQLTPAGEPGTLNGNPQGSGTFTATLDTSTNVFTWTSTFAGLTSNINNGHIHGPFTPGGTTTTAGVVLNFNPQVTAGATFSGLNAASSGATTGAVTLNTSFLSTATVNGDSLRKLIISGLTYVNIHTVSNGGGEIRGQLVRFTP